MPWLSLLARFWYLIPILLLSLSTWYYKHEYQSSVLKYDTFVLKTEVLGEQAKAENLRKEKDYADKINTATAGRKLALDGLRHALNTPSRTLSEAPRPTPGSDQICFEQAAYSAAMGAYRDRLIRGLAAARQLSGSGDEAAIDSRALLGSWPH